MKRILREPLLHFVLLGAALFGVYAARNPAPASAPEQIVVTAGQVDHLAIGFTRTWQRPPTGHELKGLVDDHVKEVIFSREAVKLGLDRDDTVIRRRLRQKMEFVAEDFAVSAEPTEAQLRDYFRVHEKEFRRECRFSFRHIFLSDDRGEQLPNDVAAMLKGLTAAESAKDPETLGDPTLLPVALVDEPRSSLAAQFGEAFTEALDESQIGTWNGPVRSAYGTHLVLVTDRMPELIPLFEEVRDRVKLELLASRRQRVNRDFLDALLDKYEVTVEWPQHVGAGDVRTASLNP
jgi:hypothetical protein